MPLLDKVVMAVCLFAGFFWLRERARGLNLESQRGKAIFGVFGVLTGLLIGEKYLFERWHFGPYTDLLLKAGFALGTFAAVGLLFLKPVPAEAEGAEEPAPPEP